MCGDSASTLGVRQEVDIAVENGRVRPQTGGMSVVCDAWHKLPSHRKPLSKGGTSDDHLLFVVEEQVLPLTLIARVDRPEKFPEHRAIEPASECQFEQYRSNLHSTQEAWSLVE